MLSASLLAKLLHAPSPLLAATPTPTPDAASRLDGAATEVPPDAADWESTAIPTAVRS